MNARKVAAQFAAYTWYENIHAGQQANEKNLQFAREHWTQFLPVAPKGLGELLLRIADHRPTQRRKQNRRDKLAVAG